VRDKLSEALGEHFRFDPDAETAHDRFEQAEISLILLRNFFHDLLTPFDIGKKTAQHTIPLHNCSLAPFDVGQFAGEPESFILF
jgi:hypothetical protein